MFGILGAAVASFCTGAIGCIISYIKAGNIFGLLFDRSTVRLLIYNVILFILIKLLFTWLNITNLFILLFFYAFVYFVFISLMILTRQLDIKEIISIFSRKVK